MMDAPSFFMLLGLCTFAGLFVSGMISVIGDDDDGDPKG